MHKKNKENTDDKVVITPNTKGETEWEWLLSISGNAKINWSAKRSKDWGSISFDNAWATINGKTHELPEFAKKVIKQELEQNMSIGQLLRAMEGRL